MPSLGFTLHAPSPRMRELTAEDECILSIRPVHAEPMPRANNRHQGIMMLVAKDTGHTVAISPASSNYGVIWEAD